MKALLSKKCPFCSSIITIEENGEIFTEEEKTKVANKTITNIHYKTICLVCRTPFTLWTKKN